MLESIIYKISYSSFILIITSIKANWVLLEKEVASLSIKM